eukprot:6546440-Lingulodinium_polyedra.AAC.1
MGKEILYNKATFEKIILPVGHWTLTFTKQGWGKLIGSSSTMVCSKELTRVCAAQKDPEKPDVDRRYIHFKDSGITKYIDEIAAEPELEKFPEVYLKGKTKTETFPVPGDEMQQMT